MLISERHKQLYREYYESKEYSKTTNRWAAKVRKVAERNAANAVIDYGCGVGARLEDSLPDLNIISYDPGIPEYDKMPQAADMVACMDVLEHIEPECLDEVVEHILSLANKAVFLVISCQKSETKALPDGSPWHSLVRSQKWWAERFPQFKQLKPSGNRDEYVGLWEK